jgi:hypothetical protein
MSPLIQSLLSDFLPAFLAGIAVDFEIATIALTLGVALGLVLAIARFQGGLVAIPAGVLVGLMRAAPTFVVMFFLLNTLPRGGSLSGLMIVALALVPYAAAYVADSALDALRHFRSGSLQASLLVLPNIARAFFVLVMSASVGAAIGVPEGIAVILREAEKAGSLGDMLLFFAIGLACFGIPLQAGFAVIRLIQRHLGRAAVRYAEGAPAAIETAPAEHG